MEKKVFYYKDELNEEFSGITRDTRIIDENFKYVHKNIFWKFLSFVAYRIVMRPFAWLYCKIKYKNKIVGKEKLKQAKKTGYFLYGNHTIMDADPYIPNNITFPKKNYVVVHPDNISTKSKFFNSFLLLNGALPLPSNIKATKNFMQAIERYCQKSSITIYPEAHIWPFYTGIRPFTSVSFRYPIKYDKPTYCFVNTFHKRKKGDKPKVVTYVDGPFYANKDLSPKQQETDLRDRVYKTMCERAKLNTYEINTYIKVEENQNRTNTNEE